MAVPSTDLVSLSHEVLVDHGVTAFGMTEELVLQEEGFVAELFELGAQEYVPLPLGSLALLQFLLGYLAFGAALGSCGTVALPSDRLRHALAMTGSVPGYVLGSALDGGLLANVSIPRNSSRRLGYPHRVYTLRVPPGATACLSSFVVTPRRAVVFVALSNAAGRVHGWCGVGL